MSSGRIKLKIKINQQLIEAEPGITVLECARKNDIYIPSLCALEGLPSFAGCRLCLVEIKGRPGWSPACQTRVEDGMEIITSSEELENLRRSIFELILSEHPYFCLLCSEKTSCEELKATMAKALEPGGCIFCPKDGNCELQRVAEYLKIEKVGYDFEDKGLPLWQKDPFISHNPNLCLLCGRCVRVCGEIRGEGVLSFVNRGSRTVVGTFFNRTLLEAGCSFCGSCVDVCPVAAFSEKGVIRAKGENLTREKFICPLCGCGCELEAEILDEGIIRRILPSTAEKPAFMSGCLYGRFGLKELLTEFKGNFKPPIRHIGSPVETSWDEALELVVKGLKAFSPEEMAFVFTEQTYSENLLAFLELGQNLGMKNFYWFYPEAFLEKIAEFEKENEVDFSRELNCNCLSESKSFLVLDADLKAEAVTFWLEINRRLRTGARLVILDSGLNRLERASSFTLKCQPGREFLTLFGLLKLMMGKDPGLNFYPGFDLLVEKLNQISAETLAEASGVRSEDLEKVAELLLAYRPAAIIFGERFLRQENWKKNLLSLWNLALKLEARLFPVTSRINETFIHSLTRNYPLQVLSALSTFEQMIRDKKIRAVYVLGDLPLTEKPEFLVVQNVCLTPVGVQADVFLPAASFLESSGSLIDFAGKVKKSSAVMKISGHILSDLQIFKNLASLAGVRLEIPDISAGQSALTGRKKIDSGTNHLNYLRIEDEVKPLVRSLARMDQTAEQEFQIIVERNLSSLAGINLADFVPGFRRIQNPEWVWLNPKDAERLGVKAGSRIMIEIDSGCFSAVVKKDYGVRPGTAVIRPALNKSWGLNLYLKGFFKGRLRAENE
jgi:predicted molibdopterin-dependent oxidoreductase YjgC